VAGGDRLLVFAEASGNSSPTPKTRRGWILRPRQAVTRRREWTVLPSRLAPAFEARRPSDGLRFQELRRTELFLRPFIARQGDDLIIVSQEPPTMSLCAGPPGDHPGAALQAPLEDAGGKVAWRPPAARQNTCHCRRRSQKRHLWPYPTACSAASDLSARGV
jgi:hypothetical protein